MLIDAILIDDWKPFLAGTRVVVVVEGPARPDEAVDPPASFQVRLPNGDLAMVPAAEVALQTGDVHHGDVDGDGLADAVWLAVARSIVDPEDGLVESSVRIVVETATTTLLAPERSNYGCGADFYLSVDLADATGDGRPEIVAVAETDTCEVGRTSDSLEIYAVREGQLAVLAALDAPAYALVGEVTSGSIVWSPGRIERTAATETGPGTGRGMRRADDAWSWDGHGFAPGPIRWTPLGARVGGQHVFVTSTNDAWTVVGWGPFRRRVGTETVDFDVDALDFDLHGEGTFERVRRQ